MRSSFVRTFARVPVEWPKSTLLVFLVLAAAALYPPPSFQMHQEDVNDLDSDDPEIRLLAEFNRKFGDEEVLLVALESKDAFAEDSLRHLERVSEAVANLPTVDRVYSLFTVDDFKVEGGQMGSERFLREQPRTPEERAAKRDLALHNSTFSGFLLSKDGTVATVTAVLRKENGAVPQRAEVAKRLREIAADGRPADMHSYVTGRGALFLEADEAGRKDLKRYLWLTPLLIVGLLYWVFRSFRSIAIALFVCGLAVTVTVALYIRAGNPAGMMFAVLPIQVGVICLSDIIHLLARGQECVLELGREGQGGDKKAALRATMEHMIPACFYTALTSAIGFFSFTSAGLGSLVTLGLWVGIGILLAWVLAMTLVPALLALLPSRRESEQVHFAPWISGYLVEMAVNLVASSKRKRTGVTLAWIVALVIAGFGVARLDVDSDFTSYLPPDSETSVASRILRDKLAGTATLEVLLEGEKLCFEEPYAIAALASVDAYLHTRPEVDKTFSVLDFMKRMSEARGGGKGTIPSDPAGLTEAFFVLEGSSEVDRFITKDRDAARISIRLNAHSTKGPVEVVRGLEEFRTSLDPRLKLSTTGVSKIFAATSQALVYGETKSLFQSLFWVSLALLVAVRSWRMGLIALLPNVAPILITLGTMGWLHVPLDIATILVGSMALGIAVDDTIHLITRHTEEQGIEPRGALVRTLRSSGHPSIFTTFVFTGGFLVFLLSSFPPMRAFGALAAYAMIVAMFADLTLLPLLLRGPRELEPRGG